MNVRPDVLAFADVDGFAQLDSQPYSVGDLLGVGLLETFPDENVVGKAPNRRGKNNPGPRISYMRQRSTV